MNLEKTDTGACKDRSRAPRAPKQPSGFSGHDDGKGDAKLLDAQNHKP